MTAASSLTSSLDVSIISPAYNEEARIEPPIRTTLALLAAHPLTWEVVCADRGSHSGW